MIANYSNTGVSVISGDKFVCLGKTRSEAAAILKARGLNDQAIDAVLSRPVPDHEWRTAFLECARKVNET